MGQLFSQGARESPNETGLREYTRHIVIEKGKLENKRVVVIGDGEFYLLVKMIEIID